MKKTNKLAKLVLAGALAMSVIGTSGTATLAAEQNHDGYKNHLHSTLTEILEQFKKYGSNPYTHLVHQQYYLGENYGLLDDTILVNNATNSYQVVKQLHNEYYEDAYLMEAVAKSGGEYELKLVKKLDAQTTFINHQMGSIVKFTNFPHFDSSSTNKKYFILSNVLTYFGDYSQDIIFLEEVNIVGY